MMQVVLITLQHPSGNGDITQHEHVVFESTQYSHIDERFIILRDLLSKYMSYFDSRHFVLELREIPDKPIVLQRYTANASYCP